MDCYICGSEKAKWPISSKHDSSGKPFFPFLDYHKRQSDTNDGKFIACNVCYSFLIQQWNMYEENDTPLLKRLYWLKHSPGQQEQLSMSDNLFFEQQSNMSDDEKQSVCEQVMVGNTDNLDASSNDADQCFSQIVVSNNDNIGHYKETGALLNERASSTGDDKACLFCGQSKAIQLMRTIHTKPQLKKETPFFPTLIASYPDLGVRIDGQGKILSCEECHQMLLYQWELYSKKGTPISERKYVFSRKLGAPFVCFICGGFESLEANLLKCKRIADGEPFFPFLKNLRKPPGADPVSNSNTAKCCHQCAKILLNLWYEYHEAGIPVYDQVYSVMNGKQTLKKPLTLIHASVPNEVELVCPICQRKDLRKEMKEVYSNPYANMDLSFLQKIQRLPGSYMSRSLGQTLVCLPCYRSLTYQWAKFDRKDVPLSSREYSLQRYEDCLDDNENDVKCDICHTYAAASETYDLDILPRQDSHNHPFFPCLAKLKADQSRKQPVVTACRFCNQNLMLQWNHFERDSKTSDDRWKRNYKPHHFVCFVCGGAASRSEVTVVNKRSLSTSYHQKPLLAVEVNGIVVLCLHCKELVDAEKSERNINLSDSSQIPKASVKIEETGEADVISDTERVIRSFAETSARSWKPQPSTKDSKDFIGMKVTATVPPLPSLQRNQDNPSMQSQSSGSRNDDEGSFAAALRKLAQQAIAPATRRPSTRERQASPSSSFKSVSSTREGTKSPARANSGGHQSQSPFYPRGSIHPGAINSTSVAPIAPPSVAFEKEKPDIHGKSIFGGSSSSEELPSRRLSRPVVSGLFGRHDANENAYRQSRDEGGLHHKEKNSMRDPDESGSVRAHTAGGIFNGPNNGQINILGVKDRGSNIGLVHPQPVRKLQDDDAVKSSLINNVRCNPIESPGSLFRPPSPSDSFSRYQLVHGLHQHSGQGSCPVHGHETGHHHESPRGHTSRPSRLPFEGMAPRSGPLPDYRGIHSHHQRVRDDLYGMNRIPVDRRDGLPSHILEEDMRRRGYDWPWPMQHPFYENEQYRRHMVNGYRGNEHAYKDMVRGPHYFSPHLYYPPEYPHNVDPYPHSSISHSEMFPNRYGSNQPSPRLVEYYRRERSLSERTSERGDSRRQDSAGLKLDAVENERRNGDNFINEERNSRRHEMADYFSGFSREVQNGKDERKDRLTMESIPGNSAKRSILDSEEPKRKLRIMEKLDLIAKPCEERGTKIDNIVVKEEPNVELPASFAVESSRDELQHDGNDLYAEDSDNSNTEITTEDIEKKSDFLSSVGLITHGKKRVLEEDYERKRWERKVAKMRGKPRKRGRREQTEDSDGRPCSDIDFYNGPMTRHKQQLLQEQEMLLEQVQKNHLERNLEKESNMDNKNFSSSTSPSNSSVASTTPNSITEHPLPTLAINRRRDDDNRSGPCNSQSFKPYKGREGRKEFLNGTRNYPTCDDPISGGQDCQELDSYVFGLPQMDVSATKLHWTGIDNVARLYMKYENEREIKENLLKNTCDKLKCDRERLNQQRQQHQKDILTLRDKRSQLNENVRMQQQVAKNLHRALQKFLS